MRSLRAVLFDLDETLIVDQPWAEEALLLTCSEGTSTARGPELAAAVAAQARRRWDSAPDPGFVESIGMTWWEGLTSTRPGGGAQAERLAAWLPGFRDGSWRAAVESAGPPGGSIALAGRLAAAYAARRRSEFRVRPEAPGLLDRLRGQAGLRLGMITNGPSDLQHEKLERTGLARHFEAVVVSGDLGTGKPDPRIFERALDQLGVEPEAAVMVGDSPGRDVAGARQAKVASILLSASAPGGEGALAADHVASDLAAAGRIVDRLLGIPARR